MPDLETSLTYCTYCPKLCRHTCPVADAEARETVVPQAKMATMRVLRTSPGPASIAPTVENAASLYACSGCLACTTACNHGITPGIHLFTGRAEVEAKGLGHPALRALPERVRATATKAARAARAAVPAARIPAEAQVAWFPGCVEPESGRTALALFDRLGADYVGQVDVSLGCGGYPLLAGGFPEAFRLHAEALSRELRGYARLLVACPGCAWAMKEEYPRFGVPLRAEILNPVEFLEQFVERLPVRAASDGDSDGGVFYHDPCYLGRHQQVYDAPRRLLAKVNDDVREFSRNRAESVCSGGGGVLPLTAPDTAATIAENRLAEVRETANVRTIVTGCPTCKRQLARDDIRVRDVVEVLEEATRP